MVHSLNKEINKKITYLKKLKSERVMGNYNDGWYNLWVDDRISIIEGDIDKLRYKHKFK